MSAKVRQKGIIGVEKATMYSWKIILTRSSVCVFLYVGQSWEMVTAVAKLAKPSLSTLMAAAALD